MIPGVVTVNVAVALSAPPSDPVAVTVYAAAAPLTVNVQPLIVPVPVAEHALAAPIVPPAEIVNVIVTPGVKPLPDTVTVAPLGPCVGTSATAGVVTVNVAVALSKAPSDPVAVTVYAAAAPLTVNVQPLNVPVPVAVHTLAAPTVPPAEIVNAIVTPGVNPVPDAVTVTPLGPRVGVSVTAGVVIVNVAVALSEPPSDPVAVTVYGVAEAVPVIVTVQLNVPVAVTVAPHAVIAAPAPMVPVIVLPGVNPVPEMRTDTPLGPSVGVSVIAGSVIVNVVVALS